MSDEPRYVLLQPAREERREGHSPLVRLLASATLVFLLGFSGLITWNWVERNLLHWGIDDGKTAQVNSADLLQRLQVFQVVSVRDTYAANARIDVEKVFRAGPAKTSLPSWLAGQDMKISGKVLVSAGVDLGALVPSDIQVQHNGRDTHLVISVPAPQVIATELVPNSMNMDTSQGILTRLKIRLGFSEADLRDQSVDQLSRSARKEAERTGLLDEAGRQVQVRLETFLATLSQADRDHVTYEVRVRTTPVG